MTTTLPKHLVKLLSKHKTSLGENPAFPPEEETTFDYKIITSRFEELCEKINNFDDIGELTEENLTNQLSKLVHECQKIEKPIRDNLEKLCINIINDLLNIPEDALVFECNLVDYVDKTNERTIPEETTNDDIDSVNDIRELTKEVYKRRLINSLIQGISAIYSNNISLYIKEIYELNHKLPDLYEKINVINNFLLFIKPDKNDDNSKTQAGYVNVFLGNDTQATKIESKAIIFPILLNESLRGFFELFSSHGLPEDKKKALYVIKKADFSLAEAWDIRFGVSLWNIINDIVNEESLNIEEIGLPFIFTEIVSLPVDEFNNLMQEVFAKTKEGKKRIKQLIEFIFNEKEKDNFDEYLNNQNSSIGIIDNEYFTEEDFY